MENIPGLGVKTKEKLGIKTIEDLYKVYDQLPVATKAWLKYKPERIKREVIDKLNKSVGPLLKNSRFIIAGSYRRGLQTSGDIDIVLLNNISWDDITKIFKRKGYELTPPYMIGEDRMSTFVKLGRKYGQVDFFKSSQQEYIFNLLYVTGNRKFNITQRHKAKNIKRYIDPKTKKVVETPKGLLLNQRGLYKVSNMEPINVDTEEEIFTILDMEWKAPEQREI